MQKIKTQTKDELADIRLYAVCVETGHAFKIHSLEEIKRDGAELIRLGQSILDNADKGFARHKNPNNKAFVKDIFGFKR